MINPQPPRNLYKEIPTQSLSHEDSFGHDGDALKLTDPSQGAGLERPVSMRYRTSLACSPGPVGRIPPEILLEIFGLVMLDYSWAQGIVLSQVCHSWRALALGMSELWWDIKLRDRRLARLFLDRCYFTPLHVSSESYSKNTIQRIPSYFIDDVKDLAEAERDWKDMLDSRSHKIQSLSFSEAPRTLGALLRCLHAPFPLLTTLRLLSATCTFHERSVSTLTWDVVNTTPSVFPALRFVDLDMVRIPWGSGVFENLVRLRLHRQWITKEPSQEDPSMEELVRLLERCPGLECLDLRFAGPRLPHGTTVYPDPVRTVYLSALREFRIEDEVVDIGHMLAHVSFPLSTQLFVKHRKRPSTRLHQLVPAAIPRDKTNFKHLNDIRSFTYHVESGLNVFIRANNLDLEFSMFSSDIHTDDDDHDHSFNFLIQFMAELPLLNAVEEIGIKCNQHVYMQAEDWVGALARLPSLRVLSYSHYQEPEGFKVGLELCGVLRGETPNGVLVCPNLERLVLKDIDFEICDWATSVDGIIDVGRISRENTGSWLVDCVRHRALRGHRLKQLTIQDARNLQKDTIEFLRQHVDTLECSLYPPR